MRKGTKWKMGITLIGIMMVLLINTGCQQRLETEEFSYRNEIKIDQDQSIVLGKKLESPFSVMKGTARSSSENVIEGNYYYFRCRNDVLENVLWLKEKFGDLETIPMDYEIVQGGSTYIDPENEGHECPWIYFIETPDNYSLIVEKGFETEILDVLDVPEEVFEEETFEDIEMDYSSRGITKKSPYGTVNVYSLSNNMMTLYPVKNVTVRSRQILIYNDAVTNDEGKFSINKTYNSFWGKVTIKLIFENSNCILKKFESLADLFTSANYSVGTYSVSDLSNMNILIKAGTQASKNALVISSVKEYRDYCIKYSVTLPKKLNIWLIDSMDNSATLMAQYIGKTAVNFDGIKISSFGDFFISLMKMISNASASTLPDILVGSGVSGDSPSFINHFISSTYHELAHASHYFGFATSQDAKQYWINEYSEMVKGWIKMVFDGKNPFDDPYNNGNSELACLIESWGYFFENYLMADKTGDVERYLNYVLEKNGRNLNNKIYHDGFYDLIDTYNEPNIDFCSGYTVADIHNTMKDKSVVSLTTFAEKLSYVTQKGSDYENVLKTLKANCER